MESQDLRKAGLKVTHPRMRILELLEQTRPRHMTAEDIYKQLLGDGEQRRAAGEDGPQACARRQSCGARGFGRFRFCF